MRTFQSTSECLKIVWYQSDHTRHWFIQDIEVTPRTVESEGELAAGELSVLWENYLLQARTEQNEIKQMRHSHNRESLGNPEYGEEYCSVVKSALSLQRIL